MLDSISFAYTILLIGALVQFANWFAPFENLTEAGCRLEYVYDGDTVSLSCTGEIETARLVGFDTPETKSPSCAAEAELGARATNRLRELALNGAVTFSGNARDKYGRMLVTMKIDGVNVSETLINERLAVEYTGGARIDWCERLG